MNGAKDEATKRRSEFKTFIPLDDDIFQLPEIRHLLEKKTPPYSAGQTRDILDLLRITARWEDIFRILAIARKAYPRDDKIWHFAKILRAEISATLSKNKRNEWPEKDKELLSKALKLFPKDKVFVLFAGQLAMSDGKYDLAIEYFERGLEAVSDDSFLKMSLAEASLAKGDYRKARENINWMRQNGDKKGQILVVAAEIEYRDYRTGNADALPAARELANLLTQRSNRHPANFIVAAKIELEAYKAGERNALATVRKHIATLYSLDDRNPSATFMVEAQTELAAFKNKDGGSLAKARELINQRLNYDDDHEAAVLVAVQIEIADFRTGTKKALTRAFEYAAIISPDHKASLVTLAQLYAEAYYASDDEKHLTKAREFSHQLLKVDGGNRAAIVTAAQIELEAFYKTKDSNALLASHALIQRRLTIGDKTPPVLVTAAQIAMEARLPQIALQLIQDIPENIRRDNQVLTYIEAKAQLWSGFSATAKQLLTPIMQTQQDKRPDEAFITLYLACFDLDKTAEAEQFAQMKSILKHIVPQDKFDTMLHNAKVIRETRIEALPEDDKTLHYGSKEWLELGTHRPAFYRDHVQLADIPPYISRTLQETFAQNMPLPN